MDAKIKLQVCTIALAVLWSCTASAGSGVTFSNATNSAGVQYVQQVPLDTWCPRNAIPTLENFYECLYRNFTGGLAIGDFDNDGLDDIFATRMTDTDLLFKNNGDGTYTDVSAQAGFTEILNTNGALWVDVDNDGDLDLYVTTVNEPRFYFYLNNGDGTFTEDAIARGLDRQDNVVRTGWSIGTGDYNRDGFLDLFVGEWYPFLSETNQSRLLLNKGLEAPGYFEDANDAAGIILSGNLPDGIDPSTTDEPTFVFAPAFVDLDQDGWLDIAIAADFSNSQLFWNNGDGTFTDGTQSAAVGTDENGMGSTFGDLTGNGYLDWFVTAIWDDCNDGCVPGNTAGNRLYTNNGDRTFTDGTDTFGVRNGDWGWGASLFDYNNNTLLDLVMTNGYEIVYTTAEDMFNTDVMRFWENNGNGTMTEIGASIGITDTGSGKGLVTFDYDGDGDLDIMVVNTAGDSVLYQNNGGNTAGDWIRVKFQAANRPFEGLNAKIRLQLVQDGPIQYREMGIATHFMGQSERVAHFGLGTPSAEPIHEITVEWLLTGEIQTFNDVPRNQAFVITAPAGEVVDPPHNADQNGDFKIGLAELLRIIQLFNCGEYHIDAASEDGFSCGTGDQVGLTHTADFVIKDWKISLTELLRIIQFFNSTGFYRHYSGEDGYLLAVV